MKKRFIRRKGDLVYEIAAITVAIAICACTFYIASRFTAPPFGTLAETTHAQK